MARLTSAVWLTVGFKSEVRRLIVTGGCVSVFYAKHTHIIGISGKDGNTHLYMRQPLSGRTGFLTQFSQAIICVIYRPRMLLDRRSGPGTEARALRQLPRLLLSLALRNCDLRWGLSCPRLNRPRTSPRRLWLFRSFTSLTSSHLRPEAPSVYRDLFRMSHECDSRTCV